MVKSKVPNNLAIQNNMYALIRNPNFLVFTFCLSLRAHAHKTTEYNTNNQPEQCHNINETHWIENMT